MSTPSAGRVSRPIFVGSSHTGPRFDSADRRLRPRSFTGLGLLAGCLGIVGCAGSSYPFADIDRATDELIAKRSAALGAGTLAPDRALRDPKAYFSDRAENREPATLNPAAPELRFEAADPDRTVEDVNERLARFSGEALAQPGDAALVLTFADALRTAQRSGREFLTAEESYILTAIRVLIQRHLWGPRLFNETDVFVDGLGDQGRFESALNVINTLRVTQRIPYGGEVTAAWIWESTDELRRVATQNYVQSSRLALTADIPLLRGAGLAANEDRIQTERDLIYAARAFERFRRQYLVDIARDYFDLLESRSSITNQIVQIEGLEGLLNQTNALFESGRIAPFRVQTAESELLQARARLESLRNQFILQLERFKVRLGLPVTAVIEIAELDFALPEPDVTPTEAALQAVLYRLDLQNEADGLDDARRAVRIARNGLLPDLNLTAEWGLPTDRGDLTGGLGFEPGDSDYVVGLELGLPLDRRIERLELRQAIIGVERAERDYEETRDSVIIDARQAVRNVELQRFQLELAERQVAINELRLRDLELREDDDAQDTVDAEEDRLSALDARDRALTGLRLAVLNYLLATGQLRVELDGTFQPLPGLVPRPVAPATPPAELQPGPGLD